jgi:hypothetical protein
MTMTPSQLARLRGHCERVERARKNGESLFTGERADALSEFRRNVTAGDVLALLDEIDRLAGMRGPVDAVERVLELEDQLAAVTAALDEACTAGREIGAIALDLVNGRTPSISTSEMVRERMDRIAALRQVGSKESK